MKPAASQPYAFTVSELRQSTTRFAHVASSIDLDLPIPSCPEWVAEDLVRHLGEVHIWAAGAMRTGGPLNVPKIDNLPRERLAAWYGEAADDLVGLLESVDPEAPAWVLGPVAGNGTASFWLRRQTHETVMHTWDMLAADNKTETIHAALAWDGVKEVRDVFYRRQVMLGRVEPLPCALHLEATDLECPPVVIGFGEAVRVQLPAVDMLLTLWRRARPQLDDRNATLLLARALTP